MFKVAFDYVTPVVQENADTVYDHIHIVRDVGSCSFLIGDWIVEVNEEVGLILWGKSPYPEQGGMKTTRLVQIPWGSQPPIEQKGRFPFLGEADRLSNKKGGNNESN